MRRRTCLVFALWGILAGGASVAESAAREWHDVSGQYSRQAEFVALRDGEVQLKLADGRSAKVALDKLSVVDREYVADATKPKFADPFVTLASNDVKMVQAVLQSERLAQAETIPPPDSSTTFAALQGAEAILGAKDAANYHPTHKYVYYGCHSTTHLIDLGPTSGAGTIHYCLGHHAHHHHCHGNCCGSHCTWYLAYLYKDHEDPNFFYYVPLFVDPYIDMWAFAKYPTYCGTKYRIWYRVAATKQWHRFDWASRVHPK